jgi:hypothetical protein
MERNLAKVPFNYGRFESYATCFNDQEAWVLIDNSWVKFHPAEVLTHCEQLPEEYVRRNYGPLPALPSEAFTQPYPVA